MQRWPTHLCTVSPVDVRPAVPVDMFLLWYPFCAKKTTYNLRFSIASSTAFGKPLDTVLWLLSTGRSLLSASSRCCASRHASLTGLVSTQSGTFLRRVCAKNVRVRPHLAASGAGKRVNLVTRMFGELLDCWQSNLPRMRHLLRMRQGAGKWPHMGTFLLILTNIPVLL